MSIVLEMTISSIVTVLVALLSGISHGEDFSKYNLTIGIIMKSTDKITDKIASLGIQIANRELAGLNYQLQIKTESIEDNLSFNAIQKACNLLSNGLVAIISPISAVPSRHISSLCSKFHIPHLVTICRFPESLEIFSMDVRVVPDCNQYANIIYRYITEVEHWRNMIIIHSSFDCIFKFENLINQFESHVRMREWFLYDVRKNKEVMRELSKMRSPNNFLIDIPYWQIKQFLIMASVHNLTQPQNSFIFTDWDASVVDIAAFKINNQVNITSFSFVNQAAINPNIISLLTNINDEEMISKRTYIDSILLVQQSLILDSIMLLAKGLKRLAQSRTLVVNPLSCMTDTTWSIGPSLVNSMTSMDDVYGITGKILFNEKSQRKEYNMSIMELTEKGFVKSAFWSEDRIIISPKPIIQVSPENTTVTAPLRVTTKIEVPFIFYGDPQVHENFDPNPRAWKGYCIDLLQRIGSDLNLNFSIHVVEDNSYGVSLANQTNPDGTEKWTGMIGELMTKKADLAVAPMTITYEREKVVDFTTPFMGLGLSIMFLKPKPAAPGLFSFLSPLSPPVWVYVIGTYIGVSLIIFIISRITPYECLNSHACDDSKRRENQFPLLNSLWFTVGALVRQGCDLAPQASSTRIIVGAWWFFTLIIISTYTANLAAFLTVEQLILPIKGAEDLANQTKIKYGTLRGGASYAFFEKALIPTYQRMFKFMKANPDVLQTDVKKGIHRVLNDGGKYAFLMESSWIDYYVQKHCELMKVGDLLDSKGYGIGFPEGSPLRDRMSVSILKLQKEQALDTLKHRWWNEMNITEPCNIKEQGKIPEPLNVYQIGGVLILLGVGIISGIVISVAEVYIRYWKTKLHYKIPFRTFFGKELKFAMRFMSSSKKFKNIRENKFKTNGFVIPNLAGRKHNQGLDVPLVAPHESMSNHRHALNRHNVSVGNNDFDTLLLP